MILSNAKFPFNPHTVNTWLTKYNAYIEDCGLFWCVHLSVTTVTHTHTPSPPSPTRRPVMDVMSGGKLRFEGVVPVNEDIICDGMGNGRCAWPPLCASAPH